MTEITELLARADTLVIELSGVTAWREPFLLGLGAFALFLLFVGLVAWLVVEGT